MKIEYINTNSVKMSRDDAMKAINQNKNIFDNVDDSIIEIRVDDKVIMMTKRLDEVQELFHQLISDLKSIKD